MALVEGTLASERRVKVGGRLFAEAAFVKGLREKDPTATALLVAQLRADAESGGSQGLSVLAAAYGERVLAFVTGLLNGDRSAGEEVLNDVFVRVYTRIGEFDPQRAAFRTWVYEHARYAALDRRRRNQGEQRSVVAVETEFVWPEEPLTMQEQVAMQRAFRQLPEKKRRLLWLHHVEAHSAAQIVSRRLVPGIPDDQMRMHIRRYTQDLKEAFVDELERELGSRRRTS